MTDAGLLAQELEISNEVIMIICARYGLEVDQVQPFVTVRMHHSILNDECFLHIDWDDDGKKREIQAEFTSKELECGLDEFSKFLMALVKELKPLVFREDDYGWDGAILSAVHDMAAHG